MIKLQTDKRVKAKRMKIRDAKLKGLSQMIINASWYDSQLPHGTVWLFLTKKTSTIHY